MKSRNWALPISVLGGLGSLALLGLTVIKISELAIKTFIWACLL